MGSRGTGNPAPLLKAARDEQSFRGRIVELLGGMLSARDDVPVACRVLVVVLLFLCLSASFVMASFILDIIHSFVNVQEKVNSALYAALLSGHGLLGAVIGFPITMRMAKLEEAKQLQAKLTQVQKSKMARGRTGVS